LKSQMDNLNFYLICFSIKLESESYLSVFMIIKDWTILSFRLKLDSNLKGCSINKSDVFRSIKSLLKQENDLKLIISDLSVFDYLIIKKQENGEKLKFEIEFSEPIKKWTDFQNFVISVFDSKKLEYFHSQNLLQLQEDVTPDLGLNEYFNSFGVKATTTNKLIFQLILNDFKSLYLNIDANVSTTNILKDTDILEKSIVNSINTPDTADSDKITIEFAEYTNNTNKTPYKLDESTVKGSDSPVTLDSLFFQSSQINLRLKEISIDLHFVIQALNLINKSMSFNQNQKEILVKKEEIPHIAVKLDQSVTYNHLDPNEPYLIFNFQLFKLAIENANFDGKRMIRARKSQLRLIYCLLWSFGLDLNELINLSKQDLQIAIRDQKIFSKKKNKFLFIREDESLGFVLKTLEQEIKVFFTNYNYEFLGTSLKSPEITIAENYFHLLPNEDLQKILLRYRIEFNTNSSYELSWRSIKKSYDAYLFNL